MRRTGTFGADFGNNASIRSFKTYTCRKVRTSGRLVTWNRMQAAKEQLDGSCVISVKVQRYRTSGRSDRTCQAEQLEQQECYILKKVVRKLRNNMVAAHRTQQYASLGTVR